MILLGHVIADFKYMKSLHTDSHHGFSGWHSHRQYMRIPFFYILTSIYHFLRLISLFIKLCAVPVCTCECKYRQISVAKVIVVSLLVCFLGTKLRFSAREYMLLSIIPISCFLKTILTRVRLNSEQFKLAFTLRAKDGNPLSSTF